MIVTLHVAKLLLLYSTSLDIQHPQRSISSYYQTHIFPVLLASPHLVSSHTDTKCMEFQMPNISTITPPIPRNPEPVKWAESRLENDGITIVVRWIHTEIQWNLPIEYSPSDLSPRIAISYLSKYTQIQIRYIFVYISAISIILMTLKCHDSQLEDDGITIFVGPTHAELCPFL